MKTELDPGHEWAGYERVIVFDGLCNWCNAWVSFAMRRDPGRKLKFGTLQSEKGQRALNELELSSEEFETFLLLERGRVFTKSTAALRVACQLTGLWPVFSLLLAVPRPIRDALYDVVARHRYRWMGKADVCRVPAPEDRGRFV
ncbi:MAG TPA: DCC1-like thiol-disulfide oxidoreductase family protein [Nitrospira sp.]|nr:DCC1-like thiol-disulfide oxidoreductase family protein [Nitrospira sp.]